MHRNILPKIMNLLFMKNLPFRTLQPGNIFCKILAEKEHKNFFVTLKNIIFEF